MGCEITRRSALRLGAIAGLAGAAGAACAAPAPLVFLNQNENPYGPSPLAKQAIANGFSQLDQYTSEADVAALKTQIAAFEGVAAEQIVLGADLDVIGQVLAALNGAGAEVVYSTPGYPVLAEAAAKVGGAAVPIPLNAALENDLPAIERAITPRTRVIYLINPHNPSGTVTEKALWRDFLSRISRRALVIVDEAYLEFADDYSGRTAAHATRAGENVAVFRTFDKAYGLASLSIRYTIFPLAVAKQMDAAGLGGAHSLNRLSLLAASAALRDQAFIESNRRKIAAERELWWRFLDALGLSRTDSQANFVFFDTKLPHAQVSARLLAGGVQIARVFAPYDTWVRLTIGRPADNALARDLIRQALGRQ